MTGLDGHAMRRGHRGRPPGDGALAAALERGAYEEAALRLLLGVVRGVEVVGDLAPDAREELLSLLARDGDEGPERQVR